MMAEKEKIDYKAKIAKVDKQIDEHSAKMNKLLDRVKQTQEKADDEKQFVDSHMYKREIYMLKDQLQNNEETVENAKRIVGIAQAARDVFGQDLPEDRGEARKVMQNAINQAKQNH